MDSSHISWQFLFSLELITMFASLVHTPVMLKTRLVGPHYRKWSKMKVSNWMGWRAQGKACPAPFHSLGQPWPGPPFPHGYHSPSLVFQPLPHPRLPSLHARQNQNPWFGFFLPFVFSIQPWDYHDLQKNWLPLIPIFQACGRKPRKSLVISNESCFYFPWKKYKQRRCWKCRQATWTHWPSG